MGVMLAPPLLDGTIPAFYSTGEGIVITIPFSMNRVVSLNQVKGFQVKIKTVQSGNQLCSVEVEKTVGLNNEIKAVIESKYWNKFQIGQFYKIQVAYIHLDGTIGYYSSVTIGKYTNKPVLSINNLNINNLNSHSYTYIGNYSNDDKTERVYSYRFNLYNSSNKLIDTSGDLLHNSSDDSPDQYTFSQDLNMGETHRIEYIVTTVNNLIVSSPRYRITQKQSIEPELNASIMATLNYDNGYVNIDLKSHNEEELTTGFFIIARSCENTNFTVWEEVCRLSLTGQSATRHLCKDFTVEQGKNYVYAIQQYNQNGLYSNRILSNQLYVDFEDAFLFDGKRQLKIKYNPKVSSFKKDLLETKTDTIGGKHPFIFRNGRVYYSEFPISGLISYQMDEENLFLSEEEYGLIEKTTNLTGDNIAAERIFKMKVLEWLTNGEPKVFRSPTEGNFIVRLMNSSLTPNDTVGRMLHTFNSTAYEIADFNYSTLGEMNFITVGHQIIESLQWETFEFVKRNKNGNLELVPTNKNLLQNGILVRTLRFDNMDPGEVIKITFNNNVTEEIKIGVTGSYYIDTGVLISGIELINPSNGSMTYSYGYVREPMFNTITDVNVLEMPQHQFIGEHDILTELLCVKDDQGNWVKNPKVKLIEILRIEAEKRPLQRLDISEKENCKDLFLIYELGTITSTPGVSPSRPGQGFDLEGYYDAYKGNKDNLDKEYQPYLLIDGNIISVNETEEVHFIKPEQLKELKSGNGVLVNITYQMSIIDYTIEDMAKKAYAEEDINHYLYNLGEAIKNYTEALSDLNIKINDDSEASEEDIADARTRLNVTYNKYIIELVKGQQEEAQRKGEIA